MGIFTKFWTKWPLSHRYFTAMPVKVSLLRQQHTEHERIHKEWIAAADGTKTQGAFHKRYFTSDISAQTRSQSFVVLFEFPTDWFSVSWKVEKSFKIFVKGLLNTHLEMVQNCSCAVVKHSFILLLSAWEGEVQDQLWLEIICMFGNGLSELRGLCYSWCQHGNHSRICTKWHKYTGRRKNVSSIIVKLKEKSNNASTMAKESIFKMKVAQTDDASWWRVFFFL